MTEPFENVPKFGFGLMRLPQKPDGGIDIEQFETMADMFLAAGFKYFDTSWGYEGSEEAFHKAVVERYPRESYLLATKCPVWMGKSREEAHSMLETSLKRTGAGYIDYYLLHNLGEHRTEMFEDYGMWELAREYKARGLVRHIGFSFHDRPEALDEILTRHPEAEFVQLQINYADWEDPNIQSRRCYETAVKHGKRVVVMEPVKGGTLAQLPDRAANVLESVRPEASLPSWAIRFAASLDNVAVVLSGMSSVEQMRDNLSFMSSFQPLSDVERGAIVRVRDILSVYRSIPCTACGYCTKVCPQNIAIPGVFEASNYLEMYGDVENAKGRYIWQTDMHDKNRPTACLKCGRCEQVCPQHIKIRALLEKAAETFEPIVN